MNSKEKWLVLREDDGEALGFVTKDATAWAATTIFGYVLARTEDRPTAEMIVRSEGLLVLKSMWRYYDDKDHEWYPCIIKQAYENRVVVIRTNELGFQDTAHYKLVTLKNPSETNLQKA